MKKTKRRDETTSDRAPVHSRSEECSIHWSKSTRAAVSLLIIFHLTAVFAAPFSGPPPNSMLGRITGDAFEPYLRALCLYNGYRFFAPNPGPSHLVRYEIETETGETIEETFPDRNQHWPRLSYHRFLMLSETLFQIDSSIPLREAMMAQQVEVQAEIERLRSEKHFDLAQRLETIKQQELLDYDRQVHREESLIKAIVDQLAEMHNAKSVRIFLVEHEIPSPREIEEAIQDRRNHQENPDTRNQSILTVNQSLYVEKLIYPFDEAKAAVPQPRFGPTDSKHAAELPELEEVSP